LSSYTVAGKTSSINFFKSDLSSVTGYRERK
jgi:hypothetical protein